MSPVYTLLPADLSEPSSNRTAVPGNNSLAGGSLPYAFNHPESRYFAVDRITKDQVENYAERMNMTVKDIERWLAPNLGY